jgi:hypothetical protein
LNTTVAMLLQIGLPSRRVAQEIVVRENLMAITVPSLRTWIRAQRKVPVERWEYLDEAIRPIWVTFVMESGASENDSWLLNVLRLRLVEHYGDSVSTSINGTFRRVAFDDHVFGEFQMPDGTPRGRAEWPYPSTGPIFAEATLHPDNIMDVAFYGPPLR